MKREGTTNGGKMKADAAGAADKWTRLGVCVLLCASLLWSCSNSSSGSLNAPVGIAADLNGDNYVADQGNNRIVKTFFGTDWSTFGDMGGGLNQFTFPLGVAVDTDGKIYIADTGNNRIVRIDNMSGAGWTEFAGPASPADSFSFPASIAVDDNKVIYVADEGHNRIVQMDDMTGTNWMTLGGPASGNSTNQFNSPAGIAVKADGSAIYVADSLNNRIVQMDKIDGTGWLTLGGPASGTGTNQFDTPAGIAVNSAGHIEVADKGNNRIVQKGDITALSSWATLGGVASGSGKFQFNSPAGIAVDSNDNIYVSDQLNNRIVAMADITGLNWTSYP